MAAASTYDVSVPFLGFVQAAAVSPPTFGKEDPVVHDAIAFFDDMVRQADASKARAVAELVRRYSIGELGIDKVVAECGRLLARHPDLLSRLGRFLPPGVSLGGGLVPSTVNDPAPITLDVLAAMRAEVWGWPQGEASRIAALPGWDQQRGDASAERERQRAWGRRQWRHNLPDAAILATPGGISGAAPTWPIAAITENPCARPGGPLYQRFARARERAAAAGGDCRVILAFHGTDIDNVQSICRNGLDPNRRRRQVYGPGEYFATDSRVSRAYCKGGSTQLVFALLVEQSGLTAANLEGLVHNWSPSPGAYDGWGRLPPRDWIVINNIDHQLPLFVVEFEGPKPPSPPPLPFPGSVPFCGGFVAKNFAPLCGGCNLPCYFGFAGGTVRDSSGAIFHAACRPATDTFTPFRA